MPTSFYLYLENIGLYTISFVCVSAGLAGCISVLHGINFKAGQYVQILQPNLLLTVMLPGTIDLYHFILLSVTFTLVVVTRLVENKTNWLHFLSHFQLVRLKFIVVYSRSS